VIGADVIAVTEGYLIEVDGQERENEALRRLCETHFMLDELLASLGVPAGFYWALLGVQHGDLIASRRGDVDLIAGRMAIQDQNALERLRKKFERESDPRLPASQHTYFAALELAASGGLQWPPPLDHLIAVEAKCAYFSPQRSRVMSQKASPSKVRNMRIQLEDLLNGLPFNRVALLDFIVNPPEEGPAGQAWLSAAGAAVNSLRAMTPALSNRLPPGSPAGHFVMPWGAVAGGTESLRGTGAPLQLRAATENPQLKEPAVHARRRELEDSVHRILAQRPQPLWFPVVL
jgi:hypothetical protein